jgi:RNA polymerase sigma factor (sigma-70 family)
LREPEKLRSWLCRISRNLTYDALRRQGREPSHKAESLKTVSEDHSLEPLPAENAISKEEAEILWRSLEKIPEIYREPLVLFYREHQSIETVAANLDLTEDAVKQRLSRGRKLLQEQVLAFVEGALARARPGIFKRGARGAAAGGRFGGNGGCGRGSQRNGSGQIGFSGCVARAAGALSRNCRRGRRPLAHHPRQHDGPCPARKIHRWRHWVLGGVSWIGHSWRKFHPSPRTPFWLERSPAICSGSEFLVAFPCRDDCHPDGDHSTNADPLQ